MIESSHLDGKFLLKRCTRVEHSSAPFYIGIDLRIIP